METLLLKVPEVMERLALERDRTRRRRRRSGRRRGHPSARDVERVKVGEVVAVGYTSGAPLQGIASQPPGSIRVR